MKKLSILYPSNLISDSAYKDEKQLVHDNTQSTNEQTFEKQGFNFCQIIGNFANAFIICSFKQKIYLVDQHAASEKCLYMRFLKQKNLLPEKIQGRPFDIQNIYREILEQQRETFLDLGWMYQIINSGPIFTTVKLISSPSIFDRKCQEAEFLEIVQKYYEKSLEEVSQSQKQSMATVACHNAYRAGDRLQKTDMRSLIDALYEMPGSFNCPHGRPILICLGSNENFKKQTIFRQYSLF